TRAECASEATVLPDERDAIVHVAQLEQSWDELHALGNIEADAPKIDDIAACAELWSPFDENRFEPKSPKPISQRRPCDAGAGNQRGFLGHVVEVISAHSCDKVGTARILIMRF